MNIKKKSLFGIVSLMIITSISLSACSSSKSNTTPTPSSSPAATTNTTSNKTTEATATPNAGKTFTKDELAKFNGQNGNPAYAAVDGVVYDVTNAKDWKNGTHKGYKAGLDLSKEIKASPHGASVLKGLPVVGKYAG